jgi:hypothetical protein
MTGKDGKAGSRSKTAARVARSAAALRENLKRRKAQTKARAEGAGQPHVSAGIGPQKPKV